jgi:hypothetical protein
MEELLRSMVLLGWSADFFRTWTRFPRWGVRRGGMMRLNQWNNRDAVYLWRPFVGLLSCCTVGSLASIPYVVGALICADFLRGLLVAGDDCIACCLYLV